MKLYLTIIFCCVMVITPIVDFTFDVGYVYALAHVLFAVILVIAADGIVAGAARALPKACAKHDAKIYTVSAKEKKFYEKLKIRKWKDKIPEIGHFTGFRKNKILDPKSVEYVERYLLEACYGQIGHLIGIFFGFIIMLAYPLAEIWLAVSIPVAIINIFFCVPSIFVLRYNSYKLEILLKSNQKRAEKQRMQPVQQELDVLAITEEHVII